MTRQLSKNVILRLPQVTSKTNLSRSSIYNFIAAGTFPRPISLGLRSVGWLENEIDEWILSRVEKRDQRLKTRCKIEGVRR